MNTESILVVSEIQSDIETIERDVTLYEETNFSSRADVIDFIDFYIIDRIEGLLQKAELKEKLTILKQRAEKARCELEKVDLALFRQFREKIRTAIHPGTVLSKMIHKYLGYDANDISRQDKAGYDNLDVFINGLLSDQGIPEATIEREPEMVFYQKTPARIIFGMIQQAELRPYDVFFDIGSGLGQATILVNLLSGSMAKGIEYEPAYYNYAKTCALQLNLSNVEFINQDAHKGDYSQGTVFFMYTPFEGEMLQGMLEILQKEAQKRKIRVFTYGPCSSYVARQAWLDCVNGTGDDPYKLCEFRS